MPHAIPANPVHVCAHLYLCTGQKGMEMRGIEAMGAREIANLAI